MKIILHFQKEIWNTENLYKFKSNFQCPLMNEGITSFPKQNVGISDVYAKLWE